MPPRKKANASSSSSSSSKKSTQNQTSQPCKYGIQHFFERHSLSSSSQNPKTSATTPETPKPSSKQCVLQPHNKEPKNLDSKNVDSKRKSGRKGSNLRGDGLRGSKRVGNGASEQVEDLVIEDSDSQNPENELNLRGLKRGAGAQNPKTGLHLETENTPPENLLVDLTKPEYLSDVSPEVSKCMHRKRFKFSPGMIIKQSQDDGGEEVTWKISPVNERLQAISKLAPDVVKALADASRLNSSSFRQLSDDAGKVEAELSVCILEMPKKSPTLSNGATLKTGSPSQYKNVNNRGGNVMDSKDLGDCTTQSPFRTPPSLSYHHDKPGEIDAHNAVLRECLEQRQHKKALLELLDQVKNAISVEQPASELLDQVENAITAEEPPYELVDQVENAVNVDKPASEVLDQVKNESTVEKPAFELLDQVEHAIIFEEPALVKLNTNSSKLCNKISDEISVKANSVITEMAINSLEEADVSSCDPCFLVLEVTEKRDVQYQNGAQCLSKVLRVLNEQNGEEKSVHLWDDWVYSVIEPGDTIRVIGEFDMEHSCNVNREKNLVIVHPNLLLSGTRVAGSFSCPRRAVLDERLKSSEYSIAALTGILLHQIFQAGLLMENPSIDLLQEFAKITLQKNIESLYACGVQENDMHKTLIEAIPKICNWITLFRHSQVMDAEAQLHLLVDSRKILFLLGLMYQQKKPNAPSVDFGDKDGLRRVNICDVVDIEEMAWAPKYGLKGVIDASVRVKIHLDDKDVGEKVMPLEFKTGKSTSGQSLMEHYAQLILYTLLMSERYSQPIDSGLLYYLSTDHTMGAIVRRSDLIGLIMRRNELAHDIIKASMIQQLPPMLQSPNMCKSCRHLNSCAIYHKVHGGCAESSGLGDIFNSLTNHLSTSHKFFFKQWDRLIDLESKELQSTKNGARGGRASGNESPSSCLSSIVLDASDEIHLQTDASDNRFVYRFVLKNKSFPNDRRHSDSDIAFLSAEDDLNCTLRPGDRVILSTESSHLAVARGIITDISRSHVSVSFSKCLRLPKSNRSSMSDLYQQAWRIDKDEVVTSFTTMRYNLVQLFLQSTQSDNLRKLIVDLEAPRFDSGSVLSQDPAISYIWSERNLNDDQRRAIIKILTAKDYTLILGMPGTGKTSTMIYAVKALLMRGASILLTSYTNSAVDNLLIKLKAQGIDFARIGRCEVVHHEVRQHCLPDMHIRTMDDIKSKLDQVKVVAVTCLGISSPLLANKKFDVCIIDEAGQTSLPVSLGPLMFASKFVLVGDHYQLPPLVKSAEARESGMSVSLFRRLSEAHPQAISALRSQYRMCAGIMKLSNALIYGDRLRCGSPHVEYAKLKLLNGRPTSSWLKKVLDADKPVIFINTDALPAFETKDHKTVSNPIEACIVAEITEALANHGVGKEEIGIITPYNSQANLIQHVLNMTSVEVHTIDKYQGRDKECILVSFVRSSPNPRVSSSSLLGDWHRINVALTRAKKKLIMLGSCKTLSKVPLLNLLIEKVDEQSGIFCMSKNDIKSKTELKRCSHTT